ncbi:DUF924 family protein [Sneathiella sp.]|uniref:DUF924 family protein n=1 Tax=Sneathiella sp. TaxID=1964365 RepID=UPI00261629D4|nr:DUF924 family protein [Sneathiella sp.]MDF2366137.1 DUF924 domain-containing protein [Sneathiella sp.]
MDRIQEILDFWFLPEDHEDYGKPREVWFKKDNGFDAEIQDRFLDDFEKAETGAYLDWTESARGSLALILLFDQFTRNMFRDSPRAFSADGKACEIARHMLSRGFYDELSDAQKQFAALPFEHSEDIEDQKLSMRLFQQLGSDELVDYAERHYVIIERFGRFPHRNEQLGRKSTKAEEAFLKEPNSSF